MAYVSLTLYYFIWYYFITFYFIPNVTLGLLSGLLVDVSHCSRHHWAGWVHLYSPAPLTAAVIGPVTLCGHVGCSSRPGLQSGSTYLFSIRFLHPVVSGWLGIKKQLEATDPSHYYEALQCQSQTFYLLLRVAMAQKGRVDLQLLVRSPAPPSKVRQLHPNGSWWVGFWHLPQSIQV